MEDKSVFLDYFGNYPLMRVLDFLILGRDFDYTKTEIARNSGVGWITFSPIWQQLIDKNIVVYTRKIGNAKLFQLNVVHPWIKGLINMDKMLCQNEVRDISK